MHSSAGIMVIMDNDIKSLGFWDLPEVYDAPQ